jgi:hypothetical protein
MKSKIYYIRQAVTELNKARSANTLGVITVHVNKLVTLHQEALGLIGDLEQAKEWELLQGAANYENLAETIEIAYREAKDKYHLLHWDLHGFNAYN